MKILMGAAVIAMSAGLASADVYNDNVGNHLSGGDLHDFFQSQGFDHLDIVSVEVTNDATNLNFSITLNADIDATAWGNYMIGIDSGAGGDTGNAWGRPINWNGVEIDHWIGTWANDGGSGIGGQVWNWDGGAWNQDAALSGTDDSNHASGVQSFSVALADLGLSVGDTIFFDLVTSGGGADPGVDHLSRSDFATDNWGTPSTSGQFLSYTLVPAPGTAALLGLGGIAAIRRRR